MVSMRLVLVPAHGALHLSREGVAAISYRRWASLAASNPASSLEKYEIGRRSGSASVRSAGGPRLSLPGGMLWHQGFSRPDYLPRNGATAIKQPWGLCDARAPRALRPHSFSLLSSHIVGPHPPSMPAIIDNTCASTQMPLGAR
jgi:hypothetical protein